MGSRNWVILFLLLHCYCSLHVCNFLFLLIYMNFLFHFIYLFFIIFQKLCTLMEVESLCCHSYHHIARNTMFVMVIMTLLITWFLTGLSISSTWATLQRCLTPWYIICFLWNLTEFLEHCQRRITRLILSKCNCSMCAS